MYCTVMCSTVLYCRMCCVLYCTVLYCAVQYCVTDSTNSLSCAGSYGKLLGSGGPASISSHRYSPYPLPSLNTTHGGGVQYSVSSPLMSHLSAPAVPAPQSGLEAAVAGVGSQGGAGPVSGYQMVDWSSLGYTLPAPMYATL